jgi:hypothetical protein
VPNCNFCAIFVILLIEHLVQFGINFDSHVEIHLTSFGDAQITVFEEFEVNPWDIQILTLKEALTKW